MVSIFNANLTHLVSSIELALSNCDGWTLCPSHDLCLYGYGLTQLSFTHTPFGATEAAEHPAPAPGGGRAEDVSQGDISAVPYRLG